MKIRKTDIKNFAASMIITLLAVFTFFAMSVVNENSSKTGGLEKTQMLSVKSFENQIKICFMGREYKISL